MTIPSSRRTARLAAAAVVSAGALITTTALALPASAQPQSGHHTLFVRQIAFGADLHHRVQLGDPVRLQQRPGHLPGPRISG